MARGQGREAVRGSPARKEHEQIQVLGSYPSTWGCHKARWDDTSLCNPNTQEADTKHLRGQPELHHDSKIKTEPGEMTHG